MTNINSNAAVVGNIKISRAVSVGVLAVAVLTMLLPFVSLIHEGEVIQPVSGYDLAFRVASWYELSVAGAIEQALMLVIFAAVVAALASNVFKATAPGVALAAIFIAIIGALALGHGLVSAELDLGYSIRYAIGFYLLLGLLTVSAGANIHLLSQVGARHVSAHILSEAGMMLALALLLSLIKIFSMPAGGSVTAGSMIPIVLIAMVRGPVVGIAVGTLLGLLKMLLGGYVIAPVQALLDYPLAFAVLGLAGLFWNPRLRSRAGRFGVRVLPIVAVFVVVALRFLCHFLSGVWFFGHFAPAGQPVWLYSVIYNSSYLVPEFIITGLLAWMLVPALSKYISTRSVSLH